MLKKLKIPFGILCIFSATLSFLYYVNKNRLTLNGLLAPININVEIDKTYIDNLFIIVEPKKEIIQQLTPTTALDNDLRTVIINAELRDTYVQGISIRVPADVSHDVVSAIDSISIFIGNKLFYFYPSDIASWDYSKNLNSLDYSIPAGIYEKSLIKPWINWYGDLNLFLLEVQALITKPHKFLFVYIFLLIFFLLFLDEIQALLKKYNKQAETVLLILLVTIAFLLRIDGMTRYSAWNDELASADTSNPNNPINSIFSDRFYPPFYFLLLRIMFATTGWTETSGRLLSVLIGTGGILTIYFFVKSLCGKKYAFVSALLMAICRSSLGYSNEIRAYILVITLCPLVSCLFINLIKTNTRKAAIFYAVLAMLLVNTHYYAVFYIAGNFFFYFIFNHYSIKRLIFFFTTKQFVIERRKILYFVLLNFVIALSVIPNLAYNIIFVGLMNEGFTTWHPKPGKIEFYYCLLVLFIYLSCRVFTILADKYKKLENNKLLLLNYSIYLIMFIYLAAYFISISYRNVFLWRYLVICRPFIITILPVFVFIFKDFFAVNRIGFNKFQVIISILLLTFIANFINNLTLFGNGNYSVFKESREYFIKDSKNYLSTGEFIGWRINRYKLANEFYGGTPVPVYSKNIYYDYYYMNPANQNNAYTLDQMLVDHNIEANNILKIRPSNRNNFIYKIKGNPILLDEAYTDSPNGKHIGEITGNVVVKQEFLSNDNNLCEVNIYFATFARSNSGLIKLELYEENEILINEETIDCAKMLDNSYLRYRFNKINNSRGKQYSLIIKAADAVSGNAVTIWCTEGDSFEGNLFINEQKQSDNLCILIGYDYSQE
jgi:uncharacterized membrane protein